MINISWYVYTSVHPSLMYSTQIASKYLLLQIRENSTSITVVSICTFPWVSQKCTCEIKFERYYQMLLKEDVAVFSHLPPHLLYLCFIFASSQGWETASPDLYFIISESDHLFLSFWPFVVLALQICSLHLC